MDPWMAHRPSDRQVLIDQWPKAPIFPCRFDLARMDQHKNIFWRCFDSVLTLRNAHSRKHGEYEHESNDKFQKHCLCKADISIHCRSAKVHRTPSCKLTLIKLSLGTVKKYRTYLFQAWWHEAKRIQPWHQLVERRCRKSLSKRKSCLRR